MKYKLKFASNVVKLLGFMKIKDKTARTHADLMPAGSV